MGRLAVGYLLSSTQEGHVRTIRIPLEELEGTSDARELELAFQYGQNEFQPLTKPSLSVGDVVLMNGEHNVVRGVGWKKVSWEKVKECLKITRRDRWKFEW